MPTDSSGRRFGVNLGQGVGLGDMLASSSFRAQTMPAGSQADSGINGPSVAAISGTQFSAPKADPRWYLGGIVLLLVIMHLIGREEKAGLNPQIMGVGVWNFLSGGLMVSTFILVLKLSANKFVPASTFTDVVNVI